MPARQQTFAVFGDIHGRITLMLLLSRAWEARTGQALDGVLQVGDMGAYPDHSQLDRATRRHAARDGDELGFAAYIGGCEEGAALLSDAGWPVLWIRGNHEDFNYLARFHAPAAVDPWQRLIFLPDGQQFTLAGVRVGAMGGIAPRLGRGRRKHQSEPDDSDPRLIPRQLIHTTFVDTTPDILLTHAGPKVAGVSDGSDLLVTLCQRIRPTVHVFGHHHLSLGPLPGPGGSTLIGLDHLDFRLGNLRPRCWGILELRDTQVRWTWGDDFDWTTPLSRKNYRYLLSANL